MLILKETNCVYNNYLRAIQTIKLVRNEVVMKLIFQSYNKITQ